MKKHIFLLLALLVLAGCNNGKVPLGGTITFDDGTPLMVGAVIFSTDTYSAKGNIDANGKYVMGSISTNDGLPAGTYKV
ncbi:MAG: lipoprotein, partial [Planctomycetaceae bacterium]|nr:lipoprotein [Planctomycetaceae bacterium]